MVLLLCRSYMKGTLRSIPETIGSMLKPFINLYFKIIDKTHEDREYEGSMRLPALILMVATGFFINIVGVIFLVNKTNISTVDAVILCLAGFLIYFYLFAYWKHFYFIWLYKMPVRKAEKRILWFMVAIVVLWMMIILIVFHTSDAKNIQRFDDKLIKSEQSEIVETDCVAGFRMGMTVSEYNEHINRLVSDGQAVYDSVINSYVYTKYDSPKYNDSKIGLYPMFYCGKLYRIEFTCMSGFGINVLVRDVKKACRDNGYRLLKIPEAYVTSDAEVVFPRHYKCWTCSKENLYEYEDELYLKNNMLVDIGPFSMEFINMPDYARRNSYAK